jgi:hypothetical protein
VGDQLIRAGNITSVGVTKLMATVGLARAE